MKIQEIESLVNLHKTLSEGVIDYQKYAYYAITHHSTSIEGSTLTETQVINLLEYGKPAPNKPFEHHQMAYDNYQTLKFVVDSAQKKLLLNPSFIRQIGAKVMYSTGGFVNTAIGTYNIAAADFRLGSVRAGTRSFPDYKKVPLLVANLCKDVNEKLTTVQSFEEKCNLAFKIHFNFVSIHPFGDGNGRTSRLLSNYVQTYLDLPLSIVFHQDRIRYINALEAARNQDNISPFLAFMYQQYAKFLKKEIREMQKTN